MKNNITQNPNHAKEFEDSEGKHHLPKEIEEIIQYVPEEKRDEATRVISKLSIRTASAFSGPLPPPALLKGYNDIITDGAERIIRIVIGKRRQNKESD